MRLTCDDDYDVIIVGSGFGGVMAAHELVRSGRRVLMLERGGWVARNEQNSGPNGSLELTPYYSAETPYRVDAGGRARTIGSCACVGGPSVFFGGVALRMRERDFVPEAEVVGESGTQWPITYEELEPYYCRAEQILDVAGESGRDPTEPPRSQPYPQTPAALSASSLRIGAAARRLGLCPFPLPLTIKHAEGPGRRACVGCGSCDTFACAIEAKGDLATAVLPDLIRRGLVVVDNVVATRLVVEAGGVRGLEVFDKATSCNRRLRSRAVVLAAGAIGTPHLLLASGLGAERGSTGRFLTRHCSAIVYGLFSRDPSDGVPFHKQLGIHDFYFGGLHTRATRLGSIQQMAPPPVGLVKTHAPAVLHGIVPAVARRIAGLLVMAEDQPVVDNEVTIDCGVPTAFGLPQLTIRHRHTSRDVAARRALVRAAKSILAEAGAITTYVHPIETFSHAIGTARMGLDAASSAVDRFGRVHGVEALYVVDGSALPSVGAVNPSLTIAANALRIAEQMGARRAEPGRRRLATFPAQFGRESQPRDGQ